MCKTIHVGNVRIANNLPLMVISGPCQLESLERALTIAETLKNACAQFGAEFVFKGSFDKANRTSISGTRGVGLAEGLEILAKVRERIGCPVLTDVHEVDQCKIVASTVDMLQIPAFLCRQTDLLIAAGRPANR